jgi:hypothetical protein
MTNLRGDYIDTPNVVGYDWISEYETDDKVYHHQLVWPRPQEDPGWVEYATSVDGRPWVTTRIVNPERLGFDNTREGFVRLVEQFLADATSE